MSLTRPLLVLLLAAGALAGPGLPAQAASPAIPTYATYIANHLRGDPVFVSDGMSQSVPASSESALRQAVAATRGYAMYVILAPEDSQRTAADTILSLVHGALDRPGVYVLSHGRGHVDAAAYGVDVPAKDAAFAVELDSDFETPPAVLVDRLLKLLASGNAEARYKYVSDHFDDIEAARVRGPHGRLLQHVLFGVAIAMVLVLLSVRGVSLRSAIGRHRAAVRGKGPAPTRTETLEWVSDNNLRKLQRRLQSLPAGVSPDRRERAFDSAEAAALLRQRPAAHERDRSCNLVAATVLTRQGLDLAARNRSRKDAAVDRPCFFNPLHVTHVPTTVNWKDGRGHVAQVGACADCAHNLASDRAVDALLLPTRQGGHAPWWEAGCDPLWTRTGFGALRDDLATQVLLEVPAAVERSP